MGLLDLLKKEEEQQPKQQGKTERFVSQSLLKLLYDQHQEPLPHCPLEIYELYINKEKKFKSESEAMTKGKFGEGLLLGKSAKGDIVTELERNKKTGEPVVDEIRIREMAHLAKIKLTEYQITIYPNINTQVPIACYLERSDEEDVILLTELDIFPTTILIDNKYYLAVVDIKWTSNPHSTFGSFCWSTPQYMDHIQPDSIFYILDNIDLELCKGLNPEFDKSVGFDNIFTDTVKRNLSNISFFYFVIGFNKVGFDNILQPIRRNKMELGQDGKPMNNNRQLEVKERMRKGVELLRRYDKEGHLPIPYEDKYHYRGCSKCPVNKKNGGYCNEAQQIINC